MKKSNICILLIGLALYSCTDKGINNIEVNNNSSVNVAVQSEVEGSNYSDQTEIFFADFDYEVQIIREPLTIENENYRLEIVKYSLNDSLLKQEIRIDGESEGKLKPAIQVYHNYEIELRLLNSQNDTIIKKIINKDIFKDSISEAFYIQATMFNVFYDKVRANRIYCKAILSMPDSDWQEEFMFGVFFRTNKKNQLDYWKEY